MDKWNDGSLGYIGFGCAGAMLGVFSYGLTGFIVGLVVGLASAYGLSRIDDDKEGGWLDRLTRWMK